MAAHAEYATYEDLRNGTRKGFSFKLVQLSDLSTLGEEVRFQRCVDRLDAEITTILGGTNDNLPEITKFRLGANFAKKKDTTIQFDPMDHTTWNINPISKVWKRTFQEKHYDGLIVLCGIPPSLIDDRQQRFPNHNTYNYARGIRSRLTHIFAFNKRNGRITRGVHEDENESTDDKFGVVYMAFKLGAGAIQQGNTVQTRKQSPIAPIPSSDSPGTGKHLASTSSQQPDTLAAKLRDLDLTSEPNASATPTNSLNV